MQNLIFSDEEISRLTLPQRSQELYPASSRFSVCMPAFAFGEGANCRRRRDCIFEEPRARVVEKLRTAGYRGSLALRFYGSSSSIMRRKSTIKPLLHRGKLPVLNHCMHRALKTKRRRGLERRPKQNWFFYDRQTRDSESWGSCANNLLDFHENTFTIDNPMSLFSQDPFESNQSFPKTLEIWKLWEK